MVDYYKFCPRCGSANKTSQFEEVMAGCGDPITVTCEDCGEMTVCDSDHMVYCPNPDCDWQGRSETGGDEDTADVDKKTGRLLCPECGSTVEWSNEDRVRYFKLVAELKPTQEQMDKGCVVCRFTGEKDQDCEDRKGCLMEGTG